MNLALIATCLFAAFPKLSTLPDFSLTSVTTQEIHRVEKKDLAGTVWIANFIFTHCAGPCPLVTDHMTKLQRLLPPEVQLVTLTVDPVRDTPKVLQRYAKLHGARPERWSFWWGKKSKLLPLIRDGFKLAVAENSKAPSTARITHSTQFVLVDRQHTIRGYYDSQDPAFLKNLEQAASSLLKER